MQTKLITPASLLVSQVGLGCVTFGREISAAASHEMLDCAYERGVRLFDTAAAYGQGASEEILGRWRHSRRATLRELTMATKILPPYGASEIRAAVDQCLQRLSVEAIDLLYLHRWDVTGELIEALATLHALVRSGKVKALGVSNYDQGQLKRSLVLQEKHGLTRFSVVQNNHNLAVREIDWDYREFCAKQGVAVVTYSPLGAGFLTGKHQCGVEKGSRFDLVPGHQDVYFHEEARERLARLEVVAKRTGYPQTQLALAWALHQPGVASVLIGGRNQSHLDQARAALMLDHADLFAELDAG